MSTLSFVCMAIKLLMYNPCKFGKWGDKLVGLLCFLIFGGTITLLGLFGNFTYQSFNVQSNEFDGLRVIMIGDECERITKNDNGEYDAVSNDGITCRLFPATPGQISCSSGSLSNVYVPYQKCNEQNFTETVCYDLISSKFSIVEHASDAAKEAKEAT